MSKYAQLGMYAWFFYWTELTFLPGDIHMIFHATKAQVCGVNEDRCPERLTIRAYLPTVDRYHSGLVVSSKCTVACDIIFSLYSATIRNKSSAYT